MVVVFCRGAQRASDRRSKISQSKCPANSHGRPAGSPEWGWQRRKLSRWGGSCPTELVGAELARTLTSSPSFRCDPALSVYATDPEFKDVWSLISDPATAPQVSHDYWKIGRNLYYKHRLCVPAGQQREDAIRQLHEHHLTGHGSTQPTTILARRSLYWSDLEKEVDDFCLTCDQCQRAKALTRKPYGQSVPMQPPLQPKQSYSIDLLFGFPPAGPAAWDGILTGTSPPPRGRTCH